MEIQSVIILLIIVVMCILTFILAMFLCCRIDTRVAATTTTRNERSTANTNTIGSMILAEREKDAQGLHPAIIETFPVIPYKSIKRLKNVKGQHGCAVCLSEFENQDTLRMLPGCCHVFHPDCIDAWLVSNATCPICRSDLSDSAVLTNDHCLIGEEMELVVTELRELEEGRSLRRSLSMAARLSARSSRWDALIKTLSGRWRKEGDSNRRIAPLFVDPVHGSQDVEMGVTTSPES